MINWLKHNATHFLIVFIFFTICLFYLFPAFLGKTLGQNDVSRAQSTQTEINEYREKGETKLWTNQIHGGMPAFQIWAPYPNNITTWIVKAVSSALPSSAGTMFILLSGTYFLFCVLKLNPWLAAAGAVAFTFSSYNIILIAAGHANQIFAIAFFAPVVAGIILIFRGRHLSGIAITALFLALEIRANHIQMTYYLLLALLIMVAVELYAAYKEAQLRKFFRSVLFAGLGTLIAILVNFSSLWSTYEYGKETIRGRSNLSQATVNEPGTGLPREYAYQWSQGVAECLTFIIPNAYGGSSRGSADPDAHVIKALKDIGADQAVAANISESLFPLYWGEKPFTEGSFYFGSVICFLFVLGLMIVKSPMRLWIIAVIILTVLLSFGKNWPYLSDLFFDHIPFYNKFRAVESILAITAICFPILAISAINEIIREANPQVLKKKMLISLYVTGGITLLTAVFPTLFLNFENNNSNQFIQNIAASLRVDNGVAVSLNKALILDRKELAQSDAVRSLLLILVAYGILWAFVNKKISSQSLYLLILVLVLFDMVSVDRRYLNNKNFSVKQQSVKPEMREVDAIISNDKDPNFKVIDLTQNILSDALNPYFHKSIGGYSAARLKRFDELVQVQLSKSVNINILGMLNTKYIISGDQDQKLTVMKNPQARGNAWFVNKFRYVASDDEEMQAITTFSAQHEAIINQKHKDKITLNPADSVTNPGKISLVSYDPDHLVYRSITPASNIAVFSEIYYSEGWKMNIDGVEKPYFNADYLLRAAQIPSGNHRIEFTFHPASYYTGEMISLFGSITLVMIIIASIYINTSRKPGQIDGI